jgi:DNA modification methylase
LKRNGPSDPFRFARRTRFVSANHFKDNLMDVVELPLGQIIPYARNPRRNEQAIATVAASIQEFGWRQPIVVDEAMVVLAGHTRLAAAQQLGLETAPVHVAKGLSDAQARAFRIMDNRSGENAEWDEGLLNLELADLLEAEFDLGLTGFSEDELNALMSSLEDDGGPQEGEDDVPEVPEAPVSCPGDLWVLGNHRLLCGDATVATDVERVLGSVKPLLMVTDPPYGVEYDPSWRNQSGAAKTKRTGKVLNDDRADWREAWALFPGDVAYVWHGALHAGEVAESLEVSGFKIRSQIIWAKDRLVLSRGDYHWQHEPCLYAVKKSGKGHWAGDRKQTTLWQIPNKDQDADTVHGTQKPVECMRRPILNNSSPGQAIYEPFMGSGTTLIAAETTGRVCHGIELNPAYIDVAVKRWQQFTGQKAVLESDGRGFDEIAAGQPAVRTAVSDAA